MYLPEAHLVAPQARAQAPAQVGAPREATAAVQTGADWIHHRGLPHVPAVFLDSFLHRNAVNRELLAAASQTQSGC
ncbi:MAG: hypothetical protein Q8R33_13395 [Burkholderiales bacterium]|nr:hypothetical protein [Burkholderiales bacterium]